MSVPDFRLGRRTSGLFAWTTWDALSVTAGCAHRAFMAWIVASFAPLNNLVWFNSRYAEHHYRPAVHSGRLQTSHAAIANDPRCAGVHVIETSHTLGFLEQANRRPGQRTQEAMA